MDKLGKKLARRVWKREGITPGVSRERRMAILNLKYAAQERRAGLYKEGVHREHVEKARERRLTGTGYAKLP